MNTQPPTAEPSSNYMVLATINLTEPATSWTALSLIETTNGI